MDQIDVRASADRDAVNALIVQSAAASALAENPPRISVAKATNNEEVLEYQRRSLSSLASIVNNPFHAAVECSVTGRSGKRKSSLLYVHKDTSTTEILGANLVLPWTNPVAQIGLTYDVGQIGTVVDELGNTAQLVEPICRAEFEQVLPTLSGTYVPGGDFPERAPVRQNRTTLLPKISKRARAFTSARTEANRNVALPLVLEDAILLAQEDAKAGKSLRTLRSLFIALTARTLTYNAKHVRLSDLFKTQEEYSAITQAYAEAYETAELAKAQLTAEQVLPVVSDRRDLSGPLKSVKLGMTKEQVDAFIGRPSGYMLIEGAPGTGKTTVALQRIRFLLDLDRNEYLETLSYTVASTIVFVPNPKFLNHVGALLESELRLPSDLVATPDPYVQTYLRSNWLDKHGAIAGNFDAELQRAREAYFGLCKAGDLRNLWRAYEDQIQQRLARFSGTFNISSFSVSDAARQSLSELAVKLKSDIDLHSDPHDSQLRMDQVFNRCRHQYRGLLDSLSGQSEELRFEFERYFRHWLYWVYDPLDALGTYFLQTHPEGVRRIGIGIGDEDRASELGASIETWLDGIISSEPSPIRPDAENQEDQPSSLRREYGTAERSWIAWLLRNALPEQPAESDRFARMPRCYVNLRPGRSGPWHHVVIDEAQDLTVAEAAFLSSLVHQRGALTVSADFKQAVAPRHGTDDDEALRFGSAMRARAVPTVHKFTVNLRQTGPIGRFVKAYYKEAFGERPRFDASSEPGRRPVLVIEKRDKFGTAIRRIIEQLRTEVRTIAVIGIDYDDRRTKLIHRQLEPLGARLFQDYLDSNDRTGLIVASAEEVKGHEFDACIVRGLEELERTPVNHSKNRAYVALSRAMLRLVILADEKPPIMDGISESLYITRNLIEQRIRGA